MSVDPTQSRFRYVAVCDVLGFKSMLDSIELKCVADRYLRLLALAKHQVRENSNLLPASGDQGNLVAHAVFSDTLLVWSQPLQENEHPADLGSVSTFFDVCSALVAASINMEMPMRVGIACGQVCIHPEFSLFIGKPIAEAHLLEEEQKWIGGACHTSCLDAPHFHRADFPWQDVVEYDVPTKSGSRRMYALNWPRRTTEECLSFLDVEAEKTKSPAVSRKYQETNAFFHFAYRINHMTSDDMLQELQRRGIKLVNRKEGLSANKTDAGDG